MRDYLIGKELSDEELDKIVGGMNSLTLPGSLGVGGSIDVRDLTSFYDDCNATTPSMTLNLQANGPCALLFVQFTILEVREGALHPLKVSSKSYGTGWIDAI